MVISVPPEADGDIVVDVVEEGVVDVVGVVEVPLAPAEAESLPVLPPVPLDYNQQLARKLITVT
jgi:hypothetical protein